VVSTPTHSHRSYRRTARLVLPAELVVEGVGSHAAQGRDDAPLGHHACVDDLEGHGDVALVQVDARAHHQHSPQADCSARARAREVRGRQGTAAHIRT
jgi:hypothetical protein